MRESRIYLTKNTIFVYCKTASPLYNKRMKICYLNRSLKSHTGAGRFCLSLIREAQILDPNLTYTVLTTEPSNHAKERSLIFGNKIKLFAALGAIRNIIKNYDVIHALDAWPYGVVAVLAGIGLNKKTIITAVGSGAVRPLYSWWRKPLMKWAYKKADSVTAISNHTKKEILKVIPGLKIEVINHGVDFDKFQQISNNSDKFRNLQPYILSVGTWKPRKGFEYVILSNAPEEIKTKDSRIIFINNLSETELINLYKNAELFILLPQDDGKDIEGFGLVFLEAAACGLPVIATKGTSAEDAVRAYDSKNSNASEWNSDGLNRFNGILVSPKDYKEAADAILKILSDQNLKKSFAEESLKFAKEMNWGKVAQAYKKIYD